MMKEIYARGPIACSFACDELYMYNYSANAGVLREGVYITDTQYPNGTDHVMEVAGWGVTSFGTKYWVVRNSWGTYWGDMGWVKIRRGVNQQLSESNCDWAVPDVEDVEKQLKSRVLGDYMHGTRNSGPRVGMASTGNIFKAIGTAETQIPAGSVSTPMVALMGVIAGSLFSGFAIYLGTRARHQTLLQPSLLG
jgi:hypothetical protein